MPSSHLELFLLLPQISVDWEVLSLLLLATLGHTGIILQSPCHTGTQGNSEYLRSVLPWHNTVTSLLEPCHQPRILAKRGLTNLLFLDPTGPSAISSGFIPSVSGWAQKARCTELLMDPLVLLFWSDPISSGRIFFPVFIGPSENLLRAYTFEVQKPAKQFSFLCSV